MCHIKAAQVSSSGEKRYFISFLEHDHDLILHCTEHRSVSKHFNRGLWEILKYMSTHSLMRAFMLLCDQKLVRSDFRNVRDYLHWQRGIQKMCVCPRVIPVGSRGESFLSCSRHRKGPWGDSMPLKPQQLYACHQHWLHNDHLGCSIYSTVRVHLSCVSRKKL